MHQRTEPFSAIAQAAEPASAAADDGLSASDRRLLRLGYDLHDGPLQDVVAVAAALRLLEHEFEAVVPEAERPRLHCSVADLTTQLVELERSLRELAESLEPTSLVQQDLRRALEREAHKARTRGSLRVNVVIEGRVGALTASQRIAIVRVVQESLANVCEHSGATSATVTVRGDEHELGVQIRDDGCGFDVPSTLARAPYDHDLGLVGMRGRISLLGGSFEIHSRPGGGTEVAFTLARRWPFHPRSVVGAPGGDAAQLRS